MTDELNSLAEPPAADSCEVCSPRPRWLLWGGALLLVAVIAWYLLAGHHLAGQLADWKQSRSGATLLSIVDVFSCCILTWKALTVMLPAFVLAAAISVFAPPTLILRYLGSGANPVRAYLTAAVSGMLLSLCSCNVVPLFVSIYRRGAGMGPAFTFLFAGPAINVVAAIFTFQVIGAKLGIWRLVGVPLVSIAVGYAMTLLFRKEAKAMHAAPAAVAVAHHEDHHGRLWALFGLLLVAVLFGSFEMPWVYKVPGMVLLTLGFVGLLGRHFERSERQQLGHETWAMIKLVVPILLPAVIAIGALAAFIDVKLVYHWVGTPADSSGWWGQLRPILLGVGFGELMYFPILTEVAFTKAFLKLGMGVGPALAILITGPGSSLPGAVIIARAIGWKKAFAFEGLAILMSAAYAWLFASKIGEYICACMMNH